MLLPQTAHQMEPTFLSPFHLALILLQTRPIALTAIKIRIEQETIALKVSTLQMATLK
jgi:hypothetical protein